MTKIMLDAGHGKQTQGKQAIDGTKEYIFNTMILSDVRAILDQYEVGIYTCHSDARDVPLQERTNQANNLGVDVYVSIHHNAGAISARGTETFVYPTRPAKAVALANRVQANIIANTGMKNRGVKTADFHVLRETNMTAILVEVAFMSNPDDLALMHQASFRQNVARGIADALIAEYGLKRKPQPTPPPVPKPTPPPTPQPVPTSSNGNGDSVVYRFKVDGKQVGAFSSADNLAVMVKQHIIKGVKNISIERV